MLADAVSPAQVKRELVEQGLPVASAVVLAADVRANQGRWQCGNPECVRHLRGVSAGHPGVCTCCGGPVELLEAPA